MHPKLNIFQQGLALLVLAVLFVAFIPLILPVCLINILLYIRKEHFLLRRMREEWFPRGVWGVLIYSDSPVWKNYIEENVISKINQRLIVLNWSQRSQWQLDQFEIQVCSFWAGLKRQRSKDTFFWTAPQEHTPKAIVFNPDKKKPRVFRLWKSFRNFKHGKTEQLETQLNELFLELDNISKIPIENRRL